MILIQNNASLFQPSAGCAVRAKKNTVAGFQMQSEAAVSESGLLKRSRCAYVKVLFMVIFFSLFAIPLAAQDEGSEGEDETVPPVNIDSRWQEFFFETFTKGDIVLNINAGVIFPMAFSVGDTSQYDPPVGGAGRLSFSYFLSSHLFVGFDVLQGMFMPTIGEHMLYMVPMGPHIGYEWTAGRFEFPLSLTVGWAWESYLEHLYFGFFAKPQLSVLFRVFNNWSFGLTGAWWFVPQWGAQRMNDNGDTVKGGDAVGNFFELTLMAQFHF